MSFVILLMVSNSELHLLQIQTHITYVNMILKVRVIKEIITYHHKHQYFVDFYWTMESSNVKAGVFISSRLSHLYMSQTVINTLQGHAIQTLLPNLRCSLQFKRHFRITIFIILENFGCDAFFIPYNNKQNFIIFNQ